MPALYTGRVAVPPVERALYFGAGRSRSYGVHHAPAATSSGLGVVFCSPFGWDDVASYTSRRRWASRLAARGHHVLRFDLPGTGDSPGSPGDPGRVDAWCAAVSDGARWAREEAGCARVALVGLGVGGLLARAALDRGVRFEELVLWGVPATGRAAGRQLQAFARLQSDRLDGELPEGWLEVGGYVLSAETLGDLARLDPEHLGATGLERALLLEHDGAGPAPRVAEQLTALGTEVTRAPGPGYEAMVAHPQTTAAPPEVMATAAAWLAEATSEDRGVVAPTDGEPPTLLIEDGRVRETPVTLTGATGPLQGILAEPTGGATVPLGGLLFNAGALRRTGPNRLWTETARAWAARGVPTLRVDLGGIGDSGRPPSGLPTPQLYTAGHGGDARAALAWLLARPEVEQAVVGGLCSGGHDAFHVAVEEPRVTTAVLANVTALHFDAGAAPAEYPPGPRTLLARPDGGGAPSARDRARGLARWASATLRNELAFRRTRRPIERHLSTLRAAGTRVVIALCQDEPEQLQLTRKRHRKRLERWPNVVHAELPGRDHTLRPVAAQRALRELLDEELQRELRRAAAGR